MKIYQVATKKNTTNTPIEDKTTQNNDFKINYSNWLIAHSTKNSNKKQRGSKDIHFETSSKFATLLAENIDDFQNANEQI